ncbi:MAG TPA: LysR family transcriptional regulator [Pseudonocardia sp.]|jgi:DNA-binding transcriptional LysR family regulator|uniref:LysR family transcriptional regulator n=1 Tax=Pseudonocardia sp. TaxID=60912 RepID=UPI002F3F0455
MIDLRRLHVLRVVEQRGTITAAAGSLHLTPSAVSQQLRQLSHELDLPLLEPDGRRVRLTAAAYALLRHADDLAARWEAARGELQAFAEHSGGLLRLSGFASVFGSLILPAVRQLQREDPLLRVRVLEVETADSYERLLAGELDIAVALPALGGPSANDPRFEQYPLLDEQQDMFVSADHPLATRERVRLNEFAHDDWVLPEPRSCDQCDLVTVACATAGFTPNVVHNAKDWGASIELVAHGFGVCMMPRSIPVAAGFAVVRLPVREPTPRRRLLTATRRGSRGQRPIALGLAALQKAAEEAAAGRPLTFQAPVVTATPQS